MAVAPVSIITPAWQAQDFIARAVRSVLSQAYPHWEMIIIADDRQDYETLLKAQGLADPRLRFAQTGGDGTGPGAARNKGLDVARHDIIASLDADDAYSPDFLSLLVPVAQEQGAANAAMRLIQYETGEILPLRSVPPDGALLAPPMLMEYCVGYANIVFDRRLASARWPEGFHCAEDLFFWFRLLDDLPGIRHIASAHYDCYYRSGSLSRQPSTHGLCQNRDRMIAHLEAPGALIRNAANREFLRQWLQACNAIEHEFNYRFVEPEVHLAAMTRHFKGPAA
jgi:succinoglycan biosynthesis protein ExoO